MSEHNTQHIEEEKPPKSFRGPVGAFIEGQADDFGKGYAAGLLVAMYVLKETWLGVPHISAKELEEYVVELHELEDQVNIRFIGKVDEGMEV